VGRSHALVFAFESVIIGSFYIDWSLEKVGMSLERYDALKLVRLSDAVKLF